MEKYPVWIDCDPGVDDAAALLLAHRQAETDIVGISTVAGNVDLEKTTKNALRLCELVGADYPVFRGAEKPLLRDYHDGAEFHGADGLGGAVLPEPKRAPEALAAWDGLFEAAKRYAGKLELITLGPVTNVAIALAKHPELAQLLHRIVMMGGSATRGNRTPCAEYNIFADPEAAQAVFRSGVPVVMCALEVTEQAQLCPDELAAIAEKNTPVTRFFAAAAQNIMRKDMERGRSGWCIHDACPVAYLAHPELFAGREAGVFVETQAELTLGKTVTDLYSDKKFGEKNAFVVLDVDRPAFVRLLTDALTQL